MTIYPRIPIELSQADVEEVFTNRLNGLAGDYFLKDGELWIDHGGHGSGWTQKVATYTKTTGHTVDVEFIKAVLVFQEALRKQAKKP